MNKVFNIILAFIIMFCSPVAAQSFDKGLAAYRNEDYATAFKEWKPLAEQGNASAQVNLGIMYEFGRGVPEDHKEAFKWYKLAAEQGYAEGQFYLARRYDQGEGVLQDYKEALKWRRLAAEQGFARAQFILSLNYEGGNGVLQDNIMAHMWSNIATANGYAPAKRTRDIQSKQMTPADISKAQAMARECMDSGYTKCGY